MRIEQIQELSILTEIAIFNNDVEKLQQIKSIIDAANEIDEFTTEEGDEWFYSMVPPIYLSQLK